MNYSDEEKIKRLLDAQEHPEHYTDEELCEIIRDARPLAQLKRALAKERAEDEDIDVEKHGKHSASHIPRALIRFPAIAFPAGCVWQLSSSAVSSLPV